MIGPGDVKVGDPPTQGRYLVFIRCASLQVQDWAEPTIMNWIGGRWESWGASRVVGWIGPIAPMKVDSIRTAAPPVYDL